MGHLAGWKDEDPFFGESFKGSQDGLGPLLVWILPGCKTVLPGPTIFLLAQWWSVLLQVQIGLVALQT